MNFFTVFGCSVLGPRSKIDDRAAGDRTYAYFTYVGTITYVGTRIKVTKMFLDLSCISVTWSYLDRLPNYVRSFS